MPVQTEETSASRPVRNEIQPSGEMLTKFELTQEQIAFLRNLQFIPEAKLAHTSRTAPDVREAFSPGVLATVASSGLLGGSERVNEIKALVELHEKLAAIAKVLQPLDRLVSQNLLVVGAQLATHVGEVVNTARSNKKTRPHLLEGVSDAQTWVKKHHPGRGPSKSETKTPEPAK